MNNVSFKQTYIVFVFLVSLRLFSFLGIPDRVYDYIEVLSILSIIFFSFYYKSPKNLKKNFKREVSLLIIIPIISSIPAYFFHDQPIYLSFLASRVLLFWLFYSLLHKMKIKIGFLIYLIAILGLIWSIITILQQYIYPTVMFSGLSAIQMTNIESSVRFGIYRIFVIGSQLGLFAGLFFIAKFISIRKIKYLIPFFVVIIGIYFTGTRQLIFGFLFILILYYFSEIKQQKKVKLKLILFLVVGGSLIYLFASQYFEKLIFLTEQQQVLSGNYIRIFAAKFYLLSYWPSWICVILGNGWEHSYSSYGQQIQNIEMVLGYFRSDIGLIGAVSKFGIIYLIVTLIIFYKTIFKIVYNNKYIKYFFILLFITAFTGRNMFEASPTIILLSTVFYIIDIDQNKKSKKKKIITT